MRGTCPRSNTTTGERDRLYRETRRPSLLASAFVPTRKAAAQRGQRFLRRSRNEAAAAAGTSRNAPVHPFLFSFRQPSITCQRGNSGRRITFSRKRAPFFFSHCHGGKTTVADMPQGNPSHSLSPAPLPRPPHFLFYALSSFRRLFGSRCQAASSSSKRRTAVAKAKSLHWRPLRQSRDSNCHPRAPVVPMFRHHL